MPIPSFARAAWFVATLLATANLAAATSPPLNLWPDLAPGDSGVALGEETDTSKPGDNQVAGRPVVRLGNVSIPSLTVYSPPAHRNTGTAVVVCPGGGYSILATDLEGTEVCEWLNSIGVTGVLLKYRVPKREGRDRHAAPLQDAQRALGLVRQRATAFGIDPHRIGILGFSAGGHLAAVASNEFEPRTYPGIDAADAVSCRPDFTVLIYPAYLTLKDQNDRIAPELSVTTNTPPTFISISQDDPVRVENALFYALALQQAKVPTELHVYPTGGHGYGLRRTDNPVTFWPDRVADWLRHQGWLNPGNP